MMNHARRVLPPPASNKRKERESIDFLKRSSGPTTAKPNVSSRSETPPPPPPEPALSNQLLAGYLAHEFLTKGTLLGQPWDPARAEAVPVSAAASSSSSSKKGKVERLEPEPVEKKKRYVEVADLLKEKGAHLPGIVNPTQLADFLHL